MARLVFSFFGGSGSATCRRPERLTGERFNDLAMSLKVCIGKRKAEEMGRLRRAWETERAAVPELVRQSTAETWARDRKAVLRLLKG